MTAATGRCARAWRLLAEVKDPELPALSVLDLGIVRAVHELDAGARVRVTITPTYSGCPATRVIADDIEAALASGYDAVEVRVQRSPAWTTDWMSEAGRQKLSGIGVVPPPEHATLPILAVPLSPPCPRCGGRGEELSEFGSTPCKALWRCPDCREPFEVVKAL